MRKQINNTNELQKCDVCRKEGLTTDEYAIWENIDTGEKYYLCESCNSDWEESLKTDNPVPAECEVWEKTKSGDGF